MKQKFIQATSVFMNHNALLITGKPGIGKSSLAMQLIDRMATLISDDVTHLLLDNQGRLLASPISSMKGCIELRNIGILTNQPYFERKIVSCIIRLTDEKLERLPEPQYQEILGVRVRCFDLNPDDRFLELKAIKAFEIATGEEKTLLDLSQIKQNKIQYEK